MTSQEVIKKFMSTLDSTNLKGTAALDEAVRACSNFTGINDLISNFVNDCKNSPNGTYFLKKYCNIKLANADTGAIIGTDAGGDSEKTAQSIIPERGSSSYPDSKTFTIRGLTVTVPDKNTLNESERVIIQGLYSWWINGALKLIENSFGLSFNEEDTTVKEMTVKFIDDPNYKSIAEAPYSYTADGKTVKIGLTINMHYFSDITAEDENGLSSAGVYLDRVLAHELTHSVMAANINYFNELPQFISEGTAELVHGIDDERRYVINKLSEDSNRLKESVNLTNLSTGDDDSYAGGYMLLRYLAKQGAEIQDSANEVENYSVIEGTNFSDSIYSDYSGVMVSVGSSKDTVENWSAGTVIDGGTGSDVIKNFGRQVTIDGGEGNDTICNSTGSLTAEGQTSKYTGNSSLIIGGAGDDLISLTGGSDNNFIYYTVGDDNDVIYGYNETDTIKIINGATIESIASGNDKVIFINAVDNDVEEGQIILKNALNSAVNIVNSSDKSLTVTEGDISKFKPSSINTGKVGGITIFGSSSGVLTIDDGSKVVTVSGGNNNSSTVNNSNASSDSLNTSKKQPTTVDLSKYTSVSTSTRALAASESIDVENTIKGVIYNLADDVSIRGTAKDDTIISSGAYVRISTSTGDDSVNNLGADVTINAMGGDDTIENLGDAVSINGGIGNDSIYNSGSDVTISAGVGVDTIYNSGAKTSISAGNGNDYILNEGENVTISGGTGDDNVTLSNYADFYRYTIGDGNDYIINYSDDDTIQITSGWVKSTLTSGSDIIIEISNGSLITLEGADGQTLNIINAHGQSVTTKSGADEDETVTAELTITQGTASVDDVTNDSENVRINTGEGNDNVDNSGNYVTVNSGSGDDTVDNSGSRVVINALTGNDTIGNTGEYVTINAGSGADTISNTGSHVSINAGAGTDTIINEGENVTVNGGTGDDTITGSDYADFYQYAAGEGNDVITNYSADDTLQITSGTVSATVEEGSDLIISIGKSSITLQEAAGQALNLIDRSGKEITLVDTDTTETSSLTYNKTNTRVTVDADFTGTLNDTDYESKVRLIDASNVTANIEIIGNDNPNSIHGGSGDDTLSGGAKNDNLTGGSGADVFIYNDGEGRDAITDYTEEDTIVLGNTTLSSVKVYGTSVVFNFDNGRIAVRNAKGTTYSTAAGGLVTNVKTITITDSEGTTTSRKYENNTLFVTDANREIFKAATSYYTVDASKRTTDIYLIGNAKRNTIIGSSGSNTIDGGSGADYIEGGAAADTIMAGRGDDTISAGEGDDTITGGQGKDLFIYTGGNDIITDYTVFDTIQAGSEEVTFDSYTVEGDDITFNFGEGTLTLLEAKGKKITMIDSNGEATTQKITEDSYLISQVEEPWFAKEDNYNSDMESNSFLTEEKSNYYFEPSQLADAFNSNTKSTQLQNIDKITSSTSNKYV